MRQASSIIVTFWVATLLALVGVAQDDDARPKIRVQPDYLTEREVLAAELYENVLPAVVTIYTSTAVLTDEGREHQGGLGSGVLISPDCHILTAAHVVQGADQIIVKTQDGAQRPAELLFSEASADIALLQLETVVRDLHHATLGDSDRLAVGQNVCVVGDALRSGELVYRRSHQCVPRVQSTLRRYHPGRVHSDGRRHQLRQQRRTRLQLPR